MIAVYARRHLNERSQKGEVERLLVSFIALILHEGWCYGLCLVQNFELLYTAMITASKHSLRRPLLQVRHLAQHFTHQQSIHLLALRYLRRIGR